MSDAPQAVSLAALFGRQTAPLPDPDTLAADNFAAGFEAGQAAAKAHADSECTARIDAMQGRMQAERAAAQAATAAVATSLAENLAELVLHSLRLLLACEPTVRRETLQCLIGEAIGDAPAGACGRVFVHPDALDVAPSLPAGWTLAPDPAIGAGEVRAEFDGLAALASIEHRLQCLAAQLKDGAA